MSNDTRIAVDVAKAVFELATEPAMSLAGNGCHELSFCPSCRSSRPPP